MYRIPFGKPYLIGKEIEFISEAVSSGQLSGNGVYTKKCHTLFKQLLHCNLPLLTSSCTDALEMCALLLNIKPGDEVIMPSYTFVSTANAFVLRGAKIVFCDSRPDHPGMDESALEALITPRTRVIVPVHYAGVASDMDVIMDIANRHGLYVVEDAAQAIDSFYKCKPLGSIGHLSAFSFHETKNIICGEGGLLAVNDQQFTARAEIIWEKGTNRSAFWRGDVDKYGWVDVGSSFLAGELSAAFLWAQLEHMEDIQSRRREIWQRYDAGLYALADRVQLPFIPEYASNNAHMYYFVCRDGVERDALLAHLKSKEIYAVFHYQSLHASPYYHDKHDGRPLPHSDRYSECLVRLPFYYSLTDEDQQRVMEEVLNFYATRN
jgi:dTDP-4-amino-4,6-dideoxygalactose transaminase